MSDHPLTEKCGPFALAAALSHSYSVWAPVYMLAFFAKWTQDGVDERDLDSAAKVYGYRLVERRRTTRVGAWASLMLYTLTGTPVLLCLDGWEHWVAVLARDGGKLLVADSEKPFRSMEPVGSVLDRLLHNGVYDIYPVLPV